MMRFHFILVSTVRKAVFVAFLLCIFIGKVNAQEATTDTSYQNPVIDSINSVLDDGDTDYSDEVAPDSTTEVHEPDTVTFRAVPDSVVTALQKRKEFEYANDPAYWMKNKKKEDSEARTIGFLEWLFYNRGVKIAMYILLAAVLLFAVYKIIINNNLFYRNAKNKLAATTVEEGIEMETDLESKIAKAIQVKDYRKAVRYLYVKSLRELDQKNLIRYHAQATNYDYLAQVSEFKFAGRFSFLTQVYDYVWYGGFEMSDNQFDKVAKDFNDFFKEIGAW